MSTKHLHIKAGPAAKKVLLDRGLRANDVKIIPAAAGGPKWLVLYHLDKYLFGNWLKDVKHKIHLIGASAGAWRMACAAQVKPLEAFDIFFKLYGGQVYKDVPTKQEVSNTCKNIIESLLGNSGKSEILKANKYFLHVITSHSTFQYSEQTLKRKLFIAAGHNLLSRKNLKKYFHRNIFSTCDDSIIHEDEVSTIHRPFHNDNISEALLASGAIPTVIKEIKNIDGDGNTHWDGGITDYHLDLNYQIDNGLVLYPHFHHSIIPGWFDKYLKLRTAKRSNLDRVVLLYPSREFVDSLPRKLIPTRKDFEYYFKKDEERIAYWNQITNQCKLLVDDFKELTNRKLMRSEINSF